MKAISIRQPYAWLIAQGHQDVESRPWRSPQRGIIAIHAARSYTVAEHKRALERIQAIPSIAHLVKEIPLFDDLLRGGVIGLCEITDCTCKHDSVWYTREGWAYSLQKARPIPFVPMAGKINFFEVEDELIEYVESTGNNGAPGEKTI
jgi:hypothetical protein